MTWDDIKYFKPQEFQCRCCGVEEMDLEFVRLLDLIRMDMGKPLVVSSGYRCPKHNSAVSTTGGEGPHTTGKAADIVIAGPDALDLIELALDYGIPGIGVHQKGEWHKRFIHLDLLGYRIWTY